jgi:hypothetical protein
LFNVTVRLDVDEAPLLIANEVTVGFSLNVIESFATDDSPGEFFTLK